MKILEIRHLRWSLCYATFSVSKSLLVWTTQVCILLFLARREIKFSSKRIFFETRAFRDSLTSLKISNKIILALRPRPSTNGVQARVSRHIGPKTFRHYQTGAEVSG